MVSGAQGGKMNWWAKLMLALALMLAGAIAAAWGLSRSDSAARFLGVAPVEVIEAPAAPEPLPFAAPARTSRADENRIAALESRLQRVEGSAQRVEGSAGRADALLVAFAARRAIDRGVALGYLEPLLVERFGASNPRAVTAIVSGSRDPVRLTELIEDYRRLGPALRAPPPDRGLWEEVKQEFGSLVTVRRADRPSSRPQARYERAMELVSDGEVAEALAETMRLPGSARASDWVANARRYVVVQRALDEIETSALLGRTRGPVL